MRVFSPADRRQHLLSTRPSLIDRDRSMGAKGKPSLLSRPPTPADPVLDQVATLACRQYLDPKTWQLIIPEEDRLILNLYGFDRSLGQLCHGRHHGGGCYR